MYGMESPRLVTVARSAEDEFCPPDQVEEIQIRVLQMLQDKVDNLAVKTLYKD